MTIAAILAGKGDTVYSIACDRTVRDASALFDLHLAAWDRLAALPEGSLHV